MPGMARWQQIEQEAPELAARVRALFDTRKHKTMATLRRDGSPRISGIEVEFADGGVRLGVMPDSVKGRDLERDPRLAVHSPTVDAPEDDQASWAGEAKIAGRAVPAANPEVGPEGTFYEVDITEIALVKLNAAADQLVIDSWREGSGVRRRQRT